MFSIDAALFTQLSLQRGLAFPQIHMTTLQTQTEPFCLTPLENTLGASKRKEGKKNRWQSGGSERKTVYLIWQH